jgi:predicted transcriptional regulator
VDTAATRALEPFVAEIVSSYVRKNHVTPAELSIVINTVYQSLAALGRPPAPTPSVPISQSATRKHVVCLDCGWRGQTLNRHLQARHSLTENDYRARWALPSTHRLTATAYSEKRSAWGKQLSLGRSNQAADEATAEVAQQATELCPMSSRKTGLSDKPGRTRPPHAPGSYPSKSDGSAERKARAGVCRDSSSAGHKMDHASLRSSRRQGGRAVCPR